MSSKKYPEVPEQALRGVARTSFDSPSPTEAQLRRKRASIERVQALGLRTLEQLPVVEDESTIVPRTAAEIVERLIATLMCALKAESRDQAFTLQCVEKYAAHDLFSPEERAYIDEEEPAASQDAKFGWRYECVHVFLWALGHLEAMQPPDTIAEVASDVRIIRTLGREGLATQARPRSSSELLDENDLYYRLHWATVDARLKGEDCDHADEEIVMERHRALNWLIRYLDQAWDDVTTDT